MAEFEMTERRRAARRIVRQHSAWAAIVSLVPLPGASLLGVTAVQGRMLARLGKLYEQPGAEHLGRAAAGLAVSTILPFSAGSVVNGATGMLGAVGKLIAGASNPMLTAASTYCLGRVFVLDYETGGTALTLDPQQLRDHYAESGTAGE